MELNRDTELENLLPCDGLVYYHGKIMSDKEATDYFQALIKDIDWKFDEAVMFGKLIQTKRKVAWYGDNEFSYTYSKRTRHASGWTEDLIRLKTLVENLTGSQFNSCLLNLYHNGGEGVAWHSDDEKSLAAYATIASLTFGAARRFSFRHKQTKETTSLILEHGSLLEMKGATQLNWLHSLPKSKKIFEPRINLTFRMMNGN
jgi:alkylated DNA repair dioxygenase AlkB